MALNKEAAKQVLAHIDREELAQLGCALVNIPSPTGQEKAVAEYILHWSQGRRDRDRPDGQGGTDLCPGDFGYLQSGAEIRND